MVYLNDGSDVNSLVDKAQTTIDVFTKDQLNYYDLQVFISSKITTEEGEITKTIAGYRNKSKENFSWTNNR